MNNKVLTNFRDHPSLNNDYHQHIFKIEGKVYILGQNVVRQIIPCHIVHTNIGEPYKELVRLYFLFADDTDEKLEYEESCDFAPEDVEALRQLINEPQTLMESLDKAGLL